MQSFPYLTKQKKNKINRNSITNANFYRLLIESHSLWSKNSIGTIFTATIPYWVLHARQTL